MNHVKVATDFSRYPAGRFLKDGPFSGEAFRNKFLEPKLLAGEVILVDLDGTRGYGSSFLEEAFGGLVRHGYDADRVLRLVQLQSKRESLQQEIRGYIRDATRDS
jgi:hypothetical protein